MQRDSLRDCRSRRDASPGGERTKKSWPHNRRPERADCFDIGERYLLTSDNPQGNRGVSVTASANRSKSLIDDETVAMILRLHREPKGNGARRSARDIAAECRRAGHPCSRERVSDIIREAHAETIGAATSEVREKIASALDVNVERISEMANILAHVARTGEFPGPVKLDGNGAPITVNAAQRVAAAREAINGSSQLLSAVGVNQHEGATPEDVVRRIQQVYGYDVADAEKNEREDERNPFSGPLGQVPTRVAQ